MSGTIYPSNPCYLPIYCENTLPGSMRFTHIWTNFVCDNNVSDLESSMERLKAWNGTLINDVVVFDTEQDKMWFILKWS